VPLGLLVIGWKRKADNMGEIDKQDNKITFDAIS
jgi:hypothetical protein